MGRVRSEDRRLAPVRAERHQASAALRVGGGRVRGRQAGARARSELAARARDAPERRALGGHGLNGRALGPREMERRAIHDGERAGRVPPRRGGAIEDMNAMPDYMMPGPPPAPSHTTVLREEVVAALAPRAGGVYVDATLGAGGHTEAILDAAPRATMGAVDLRGRAVRAAPLT